MEGHKHLSLLFAGNLPAMFVCYEKTENGVTYGKNAITVYSQENIALLSLENQFQKAVEAD